MQRTIKAEVLEEILETADLYFREDGMDEGLGFRREYSGRGWAKGFGIVFNSSGELPRFMVAAGLVAANRDDFDAFALADTTETDSMGFGMIAYWNGWTVEGELEIER